ncbi:MAG: phosphonate C-P lyase system protein PhnH, partial [Marinibacterium sp.]|nr:phosphonate C-P lyase system protein PhnH [Marinibacterium sp.]
PGIRTEAALSLPEAHQFQANATLFPCGLDFFFTSGVEAAALPRTTRVKDAGGMN